jgi:site-specific DNA-methyltransferase (adenine-specific)
LKPIVEEAGFKFWKPLIWDKVSIGMGYHYRARHEYILFCERRGPDGKGGRQLADLSIADVITAKRIPPSSRVWATEKPVEVLDVLVQQSSEPGELVLDPFLGSGSSAVAALRHRRNFIGFDIEPKSLDVTVARVIKIDGARPAGKGLAVGQQQLFRPVTG